MARCAGTTWRTSCSWSSLRLPVDGTASRPTAPAAACSPISVQRSQCGLFMAFSVAAGPKPARATMWLTCIRHACRESRTHEPPLRAVRARAQRTARGSPVQSGKTAEHATCTPSGQTLSHLRLTSWADARRNRMPRFWRGASPGAADAASPVLWSRMRSSCALPKASPHNQPSGRPLSPCNCDAPR